MMMVPKSSVDRGWAWVIFAAAFVQHMLSSSLYLTGIFNVVFLEEFEQSKFVTSLIGAIHFGVFCGTGVLTSVLIETVGARNTVFIGTALIMVGYILTSFAYSFATVCITYGALTAVGLALTYLPPLVMLGLYFDKYRPLAFGLATMGVGLGQIWFAPLVDYLIHVFGWRGTMLIMAGIHFHLVLVGAVLRPLQPNVTDKCIDTKQNPDSSKDKKLVHATREMTDSALTSSLIQNSLPVINNDYLNKHHVDCQQTKDFHSCGVINGGGTENKHVVHNRHLDLQGVTSNSSFMSRISMDDLFRSQTYIASIQMSQSIHKSMNIANTSEQLENETQYSILGRIKRLISTISFTLFLGSLTLICLGQSCVYIHMPAFVITMGTSAKQASNLVAAMGLANIVSRLLAGVVTTWKKITPVAVFMVTISTTATIALLTPLLRFTYAGQMVAATGFSLFGNCYAAVLPLLTIHYVGIDQLSMGSGLTLLCSGIGFLFGPPIAGLLIDLTATYTSTFYFSGACMFLAVIVMLPNIISDSCKGKMQTA